MLKLIVYCIMFEIYKSRNIVLNEKKLIKIIAVGPLIFIPIIVLSFVLLIIKVHSDNFEENVIKLEADIRKEHSLAVKSKVDKMAALIGYRKSVIRDNLTSRINQRVTDAISTATAIYDKYNTTKSTKEIKNIIITALRPLVWNDGESFIWILNYDGIFQLAPDYLKHLEGKSILNFQDATGKYVVQEEIKLCKTNNEGFLWDSFTKSTGEPNKQYKQVAFVKDFGHFNWYFGSGEYLDTAKEKVDKVLLKDIASIDKFDENYVFIFKNNGTVLTHINPEYIGKNVKNIDKKLYEKITDLLATNDDIFCTYKWKNENTKQNDTKYTYIKNIPNSDWIIGSGYYESGIKDRVLKEKNKLEKVYNLKLTYMYIISLILIILFSIVSYYLSRHIKIIFAKYQQRIGKKNFELQHLNETLELKVKNRTKKLHETTKQLELLATTDSLTNIHNRYSIMKILKMEIERSARHDTSLCVVMYDIDFFKKVNDTFGHDVGDDVLVCVTELVQSNLRDIDLIGRYGGEEFLIIMPSTSLENSKMVSNRIHKSVEDYSFEEVGSLTISMGIIEMIHGEDIDEMFKRLDDLLYLSKKGGRNKISY